jgi:acyl-coenzyme A thioesterase PaaI-like protein
VSPLQIYKSFKKYPMGNYLFMKALCVKAPYFSTIKPQLLSYEEGRIEIRIPKRKAIFNHIGTIHAIAMCNLAELCGGLTVDSTLPKEWRWIPKGMNVEYLEKATTDLVGKCQVAKNDIQIGDNQVVVNVFNNKDVLVFKATINMYVSERKTLSA